MPLVDTQAMCFSRQADDGLPTGMPVQLAERSDGTVVIFGIATYGYEEHGLADTLVPHYLALADLSAKRTVQFSDGLNGYFGNSQWWDTGGITTVPGPAVHPCGGEVIPGQTPILPPIDPTAPETGGGGAPQPPAGGGLVATGAKDGCCATTGASPQFPWLVLGFAFAVIRRRR